MSGTYDPQEAAYLSFATAKRAFTAGSDTPRDFLERCLEQIEIREPQIKAFVRLDLEGARAAADAASERWHRGQPLSAVDGLPVGIKDCFDVRGWPTEVNCALFKDRIADIDAAHVDALRRGGAIVLGKTTTTELTMALPPPTWNPWDLERTPGGSSSGSAAAVAARMLPIGTGSQVRGSVIRPASICGVIGMKPTFGSLNRHGGIDPLPQPQSPGNSRWNAHRRVGNSTSHRLHRRRRPWVSGAQWTRDPSHSAPPDAPCAPIHVWLAKDR